MKEQNNSIKLNPKIHCVRIKLKKDTVEETKEWFANLMHRKTEVFDLLKEENISIEAVFLDQIYKSLKRLSNAKVGFKIIIDVFASI